MNLKLRVAIDGAQSTGKTTLWQQLREHYGSYLQFIPEASREIAPGFGIASATDWSVLLANPLRLQAFFEAEEQWLVRQECPDRFVTDSSLYLIQAYRRVFNLPVNETLLESTRYDLLLYCTLVSPPSEDGFRFLGRREQIDATYRNIVGGWCKPAFIELPSEARLQSAIRLIDIALTETKA
jgi:nicotinamide riboside kinase